jgi:hypothetical protein
MAAGTPERMTDPKAVPREWDALDKDDPRAVLEHLAKLKTIATFLNAQISSQPVPSA